MKFVKMLLATLALGAVAAAPSLAQDDTMKVQKPITVLLGGFRGTNSGSDTFTSIGARYDFLKTTASKPIIVSAYVDYLAEKNGVSAIGGGAHARLLLVTPGTMTSGTPYANLALGVLKFDGGGSDTEFTFKLGAGYELTNGIVGEVNYIRVADTGALEFRIGYRF